jgi:hypothetical protein
MKKMFLLFVLLIGMTAWQMVTAQSVTINPASATICAGSGTGVTLEAIPAGGFPIGYAWSNGGTTSTITVSPAITTTYTVTATLTTGTATANVTVTVQPTPTQATIVPGGPTTVCTGDFVLLTASAADTWQWYMNGNPILGATSQNYSATATGDYTVTGTSGVCNIPMSAPITVTVVPLPVANVTPAGPLTACYGNTVTLTADPVPGASYQWWYSPTGLSGSWSLVIGATGQTYDAGTTGYNGVQVSQGACINRSFTP